MPSGEPLPELSEKWFSRLEIILQTKRKSKLLGGLSSLGRKLDPRKAEHEKFAQAYERVRELLVGLGNRKDEHLPDYQREYVELVKQSEEAANSVDSENISECREEWEGLQSRLEQRLEDLREQLDNQDWESVRYQVAVAKQKCLEEWGTVELSRQFEEAYQREFEFAQSNRESVPEIRQRFNELLKKLTMSANSAAAHKKLFSAKVKEAKSALDDYKEVVNSLDVSAARTRLESLRTATAETRDWPDGVQKGELLRKQWAEGTAEQKILRERVATGLKLTDEQLKRLKKSASQMDYGRVEGQRSFVEANVKSHDFNEAAKAFEEYKLQLIQALEVWSDAQSRWDNSEDRKKMKQQWEAMRKRLGDQNDLGQTIDAPTILFKIGELESLHEEANGLATVDKEYGLAFRLLDSHRQKTSDLLESLEHLLSNQQIVDKTDEIRRSTSGVLTAIQQAPAFQEQYQQVYDEALESIGSPRTLDELESFAQAALVKINTIDTDLQGLANMQGEGGLVINLEAVEQVLSEEAKARLAWEKKFEELTQQRTNLEMVSAKLANEFGQKVNELVDSVPPPLGKKPPTADDMEEVLTMGMETLAGLQLRTRQADDLIREIENARQSERELTDQAGEKLQKLFQAFETEAGLFPPKKHVEFLEGLNQQYAILRNMSLATTNLGAFETMVKEMTHVLAALREVASALKGKQDPFDVNKELLKAIKKTHLTGDAVKKHQELALAALEVRLKEAEPFAAQLAPNEFRERFLDPLTKDAQQCKSRGETIKGLVEQFEPLRKEVKKQLAALDKELRNRGVKPDGLKGITGAIARADLQIKNEDPERVRAALKSITDVTLKLTYILDPSQVPSGLENPGQVPTIDDLATSEREAEERNQDSQQLLAAEQKKFFVRLATFETNELAEAKKVKLQSGDKREVDAGLHEQEPGPVP